LRGVGTPRLVWIEVIEAGPEVLSLTEAVTLAGLSLSRKLAALQMMVGAVWSILNAACVALPTLAFAEASVARASTVWLPSALTVIPSDSMRSERPVVDTAP